MTGYTNARGAYLPESGAFTRQFWASGADPLYGPSTSSSLMGSGAGNALYGGSGDDTIYVISTGDRVSGGGGVDTAYATVNFTLPGDVENLTMDARWSPVLGIGNDSANILKAVNANVTIEGRGGDDVIVSAGGDKFVFAPGSGADTIVNFAWNDVVRLSGYSGLDTFAKVQGAMTQVGADTVLKLSAADSILFKNMSVSSFAADDFQLSINPTSLKLTFADEFDSLALQRQGAAGGWNTAYSWDKYDSYSAHTIGGESAIYVDPTFAGGAAGALGLNPFSVSGGVLSISADKAPSWAAPSLWGRDYTSGLITTSGAFSQTYGYFEMRADLPEGKGSFPAFWLLDSTYNEIDVMETVNGGDQVWGHVHYHPSEGDTSRQSQGFGTTVPNLTAGFHTFGLLWSPDTLTWYVDGAAVASTATPATLNKPMYMLANYAVGGSWAGAPDGSELSDMHIDYIRAYSLDGAPVSAPAPAQPAAPSAPVVTTPTPAGSAATLSLSPTSATAAEGSGGVTYSLFTVIRAGDLSGPSTVNWSVAGSGANAASASDFAGGVLPSGQVFFGLGETSKTIWVPVSGDTTAEADETFTLMLTSPTGASLDVSQAVGTIANDDGGYVPPAAPAPVAPAAPAPPVTTVPVSATGPNLSISANSATVVEGAGGTNYALFTVTRAGPLTGPSTGTFSVSGFGSNAADAADFGGSLPSGQVFFGGGESAKTIWIPISGDTTAEADETFSVTLTGASGAGVSVGSATVTIQNDDGGYAPPATSTPAPAPSVPSTGGVAMQTGTAGNDAFTATAGADRFVLSPTGADIVYGFDGASDTLGVPTGVGGFHPVGMSGGATPAMVDISASWQGISGATVVRWVGAADKMDSLTEVDGTFEALPGNGGGPAFMVGYTADHRVAVYYDSDPAHRGGAQLVVTLDNLTDVRSLQANDFYLF